MRIELKRTKSFNSDFWQFLTQQNRLQIGLFLVLSLLALVGLFILTQFFPKWQQNIDIIGLALTSINFIAVVVLWFATVLRNWKESLPTYEVAILQHDDKQHDDKQHDDKLVLLALFVPIQPNADARQQVQAVFKTINQNENLSLQQWVYDSRDLGIWHDAQGEDGFNQGKPFKLHMTKMKLTEPWQPEGVQADTDQVPVYVIESAALKLDQTDLSRPTLIFTKDEAASWLNEPYPLTLPQQSAKEERA